MHVIIESVVVGLLTVLFGYFGAFIAGLLLSTPVPQSCAKWNKYYVMEVSLFITGFTLHLVLDLLGFNREYCDSYER